MTEASENQDAAAITRTISQAIESLRFGHVHVTVHDGRVVQIEKVERTRLSLQQGSRKGEGRPSPREEGR